MPITAITAEPLHQNDWKMTQAGNAFGKSLRKRSNNTALTAAKVNCRRNVFGSLFKFIYASLGAIECSQSARKSQRLQYAVSGMKAPASIASAAAPMSAASFSSSTGE